MRTKPIHVTIALAAILFFSACVDRRSASSGSSSAPSSIPAPPARYGYDDRPAQVRPKSPPPGSYTNADRPAPAGLPVPTPRSHGKNGIPSWQITYNGPLQITGADFVIIDLFEYSAGDVQRLRSAGSRPIAYFSAHYEDWRPDSGRFGKKLGKIGGWKGEYYVDWKDLRNQEVMISRLDRARAMGFVGIDMDNVDGPGGQQYFPWLLKQSKERQLLVGLKNFVEILPAVGSSVDFFVSEASAGNELNIYQKYGKPTVRMYYNRGAPTPPFIFETRSGCDGSKF